MHKDKKGNVFASLTEVKNKTGDIFSLVDEYGEITLTSYNKARYKISKIDITDRLEISEKSEKKEKKNIKPQVEKVAEKTPEEVISEIEKTIDADIENSVDPEMVETTPLVDMGNSELLGETETIQDAKDLQVFGKIRPWDRFSRKERGFIKEITKPLQ